MNRLVVVGLLSIAACAACFASGAVMSSHGYVMHTNTDAVFHDDLFFQEAENLANSPQGKIIKDIERAIIAEDAKGVARFFGKQVFLSLQNSEGSYYSSNQAQYVLQDFFNTHRIITFKFSSFNVTNSSSFATGGGRIKMKGNRTTIQVYISLAKVDDRWVISQFNVY